MKQIKTGPQLQVPMDIRELTAIRKLLCAAFLKTGILSQTDVANILEVDRSAVSRMFTSKGDGNGLETIRGVRRGRQRVVESENGQCADLQKVPGAERSGSSGEGVG